MGDRATSGVAAALLLSILAGPARAESCPFPGQTPQLLVHLFFGQGIHRENGPDTLISRRSWQRFVSDTLTAALPDGFTILDSTGQYADAQTGAVLHEPTEVVLVAAPDTPALRGRLLSVVDAYRRRFAQHSVGLVTQTVCAAF